MVILTHQSGDTHPNHDHIATLVRECSRLVAMRSTTLNRPTKNSAADRCPPYFSRRYCPSFIVDISDFLKKKMDAIRAHRSQFFDPNSTEPETMLTSKTYLDEIENRSRFYGSLIGVAAVEPFFVHKR
ncbi:MAG: hypothetical protein IPO41_16685 [Acidobacteria bacterium]|nr:hypothetical protein [Acidobacteriota bacterium]